MTQKVIDRACARSDIDLNSSNTGEGEHMKQMTVTLLGSSDIMPTGKLVKKKIMTIIKI